MALPPPGSTFASSLDGDTLTITMPPPKRRGVVLLSTLLVFVVFAVRFFSTRPFLARRYTSMSHSYYVCMYPTFYGLYMLYETALLAGSKADSGAKDRFCLGFVTESVEQ